MATFRSNDNKIYTIHYDTPKSSAIDLTGKLVYISR